MSSHSTRSRCRSAVTTASARSRCPLYDLMADAATAEICRAQVWQWLHNATPIDGKPLTKERYGAVVDEEIRRLPDPQRFTEARKLFDLLVLQERFEEFLTLPAYDRLPSAGSVGVLP